MNTVDTLVASMVRAKFSDVQSAFVARAKSESADVSTMIAALADIGLRELDEQEVSAVETIGTQKWVNGRPVIAAKGRLWAIPADMHAQRIADAISLAEQGRAAARRDDAATAATSAAPTTCPALIDGQLCGGALSASPVCPKCALGKQGVAQIMTCEICGAQTAVMR